MFESCRDRQYFNDLVFRRLIFCSNCSATPQGSGSSEKKLFGLAAALFQMIVIEIHAGLELPNFDAP
jgi:hypothetical protein